MTDDVKDKINAARELSEGIVALKSIARNTRGYEALELSLDYLEIALEKAAALYFELKDKE